MAPQVDAGWVDLVAAGLLVGVGTRYAGGCTSGRRVRDVAWCVAFSGRDGGLHGRGLRDRLRATARAGRLTCRQDSRFWRAAVRRRPHRVGHGQSAEGARFSRPGGPLGSVARVRDGRCNGRGRVRVRLGEAPDADVARLADAVAGRAGDHRAAGCRKCRVRYRLGIAGFCPGRDRVDRLRVGEGIVFVVAMLAGMAVFEWVERRRVYGDVGVAAC